MRFFLGDETDPEGGNLSGNWSLSGPKLDIAFDHESSIVRQLSWVTRFGWHANDEPATRTKAMDYSGLHIWMVGDNDILSEEGEPRIRDDEIHPDFSQETPYDIAESEASVSLQSEKELM